MPTWPACAALLLLLCAGCATYGNTGIPPRTPAPADSAGADDQSLDAAEAQPGDHGALAAGDGPDGEPIPSTLTGAEPSLDDRPHETWHSGLPAAAPTPEEDAAHGPIAYPVRDGRPHTYELRAYGTEIEVFMDGARVPAERIRVHGNHVGVFGPDGTVIERLDLPEHWTEDAQKTTLPDPADPYDFRDVHGNKLTPPRVMLGGRLVAPPPAVLKHLEHRGVKRDRVSMITNVIPGLALDQAGVENDDLVLAVNEIPDADPETIRAIIRTMHPGESLNLRLLRGNKVLDARVVATAWNPKHMVRPLGAGGHTPTGGLPDGAAAADRAAASAGAAAPSATGGDTAAAIARLQEELAAAKMRIAELERQLDDRDPMRKAIRPQAVPAPTAR